MYFNRLALPLRFRQRTKCNTSAYAQAADRSLRRSLQQPSLPREPEQSDAFRCVSRQRHRNPETERENQETDNPETTLAASSCRRLNSNRNRTRASVTKTLQNAEKL